MTWLDIFLVISGLSFIFYGISRFDSPHIISEFKRFGLDRFALTAMILEVLRRFGLLVGLISNAILKISSGGLFLLMLLGLMMRIEVKDSLWVSLLTFFICFSVHSSFLFYANFSGTNLHNNNV